MYSAAKAQLEQEKKQPVPITLVGDTLGTENLTEKARAAQDILKSLEPILKARETQQHNIEVLCKAVDQYSLHLSELAADFAEIKSQLQTLIEGKSANAEKENVALDLIIAALK